MELYIECIMCRKIHVVEVERHAYEAYRNTDEHVQKLFPNLSADERELLVSQVCGKCYDEMFEEE